MRLREQTAGAQSLDTALEAIAQCCLGKDRRWTAAELMDQLDKATGTSIFSDGSLRYLSTGTSVSTAYVSGLAAALSDPCKKSFGSVDTQIRQSLAVRR